MLQNPKFHLLCLINFNDFKACKDCTKRDYMILNHWNQHTKQNKQKSNKNLSTAKVSGGGFIVKSICCVLQSALLRRRYMLGFFFCFCFFVFCFLFFCLFFFGGGGV